MRVMQCNNFIALRERLGECLSMVGLLHADDKDYHIIFPKSNVKAHKERGAKARFYYL